MNYFNKTRAKYKGIIILISISALIILSANNQITRSNKDDFKEVESLKLADQTINVPHHYQINDYYCGPAALQMLFDYYGPIISQEEIAEVARTDDYEGGTFWFELRRAAHFSEISTSRGRVLAEHITGYSKRKIGYAAFSTNLKNATCLKNLLDKGIPILIITWSSEEKLSKHFRVVIGYSLENDKISNFIINDPAIGPNYIMDYDYFVNLWDSNSNWSLFISPWEMEVIYPSNIKASSSFLINASIKYPCPSYFDNSEYKASTCSASINLPNGFKLSSDYNKTCILNNGMMSGNDTALCQWNVSSGEMNTIGQFSIETFGKIRGSVPQHYIYNQYSYFDNIGQVATFSIEIIGGTSFEVQIFIISISVGGVVVVSTSYLVIKRRKLKRTQKKT